MFGNFAFEKSLCKNLFQRDEFTCHSDGKCISMEKRCDQYKHCEDFSDEKNCKLVVVPENYFKDYAPFAVDFESGVINKAAVEIKVS